MTLDASTEPVSTQPAAGLHPVEPLLLGTENPIERGSSLQSRELGA